MPYCVSEKALCLLFGFLKASDAAREKPSVRERRSDVDSSFHANISIRYVTKPSCVMLANPRPRRRPVQILVMVKKHNAAIERHRPMTGTCPRPGLLAAARRP